MSAPKTIPEPTKVESNVSPWLTQGETKRAAVQGMFNEIAPSYDRLNRLITFHLDRSWRKKALIWSNIQPSDRVLDLCCGTGDFLVEAKKLTNHSQHLGIDFSLPMLEYAHKKDLPTLCLGDACQIPIQDSQFDLVSVGWGIRNVPDIDRAHQEIFRVLRNGGKFVSIDMAIPKNKLIRAVSTLTCMKIVPKLGAWLSQAEAYKYLPESTQRFWNRDQLAESMKKAGFESVQYRDLFFGNICVHWGVKK